MQVSSLSVHCRETFGWYATDLLPVAQYHLHCGRITCETNKCKMKVYAGSHILCGVKIRRERCGI